MGLLPLSRRLAAAGLLGLLAAPHLWGQAKYAGELFELPGTARSMAMGGTGVNGLHGSATGFFNPALVGQAQPPSLLLAHREQFGGVVSADLAAAMLPTSGRLAVQLGILRRAVDRIPDTRSALADLNGNGLLDDNEILVGSDVTYFNQREWGILLSLARREQTGWQWGLSVKLLGNRVADALGLGIGFDIGLHRKLGHGLGLGLLLQDATTTQVHWSSGRWETTMPRITLGLQWDFNLPLFVQAVTLALEGTTRLDGERLERDLQLGPLSILGRAGIELRVNESLRLRAGRGALFPFTLGVGLNFPAFAVDYAYVATAREPVFDPTQQLSLTLYLQSLRTLLGTG